MAPAQPSPVEIQMLAGHYNQGRFADAEKEARRLIKKYPQTVGLYDVLAVALVNQNKAKKAVECCRKALGIDPNHANGHANLGMALQTLGHLDQAEESYRKAIGIKPDHAEAHNNLGSVLQSLGRPQEAEANLQQALKLRPNYADAHNNLGLAQRDSGQFVEAISAFRKAVEIDPKFARAHTNLGNVLCELRYYDDAVEAHRKALEIAPDLAQAHVNLGVTLSMMGEIDEAVACHLKALEIAPDLVEAHTDLATIHEQSSDLDKAVEYSKKAIDLGPANVAAHVIHARILRRLGDYDEAIELLRPFLEGRHPVKHAASLNYEMALLLDRAAEYDLAFQHFVRANELQSQRDLPKLADRHAFLTTLSEMDRVTTPDWVGSWLTSGVFDSSDSPAFIVGFPRSGTTLLDQILDSHPDIQVMEEKRALDVVKQYAAENFIGYPESLAKLDSAELGILRGVYFKAVAEEFKRDPDRLLIDKNPLYICNLPLIVRLFPDAKIILALRHPCDAVLSGFMQNFAINAAMANFFTLEDSVKFYGRVMGYWRKCETVLPLNHHTVHYESVVEDLEGEARKALDFLGLPWDDTVLDYAKHARQRDQIRTPSYEAVTQPVYKRAKYRWKNYADKVQPFMDEFQPFIDAFGYAEDS